MKKFVNYLYPQSLFGDGKEPELTLLEEFDIKTVDVPKNAIGFRFIEAEKESLAYAKLEEAVTYFLGNKEQVITKETLQAQTNNPLALPLLSMMKGMRIPAQFEYRPTCMIGMKKGDIVIDRKNRKINYTVPNKKTKLLP